jgi:uncharacterized delta-60 repeat protein
MNKHSHLHFLSLLLLLFMGSAYAQDGTLDPTYGTGGRAFIPLPSFNFTGPYMALDAQNRAVICGTVEDAPFATRLLSDGAPDPSFGTGGVFLGAAEPITGQDVTLALALPNNRTLLAINAYIGEDSITSEETRLLVLNENGQLDSSFGNGGIVRLDLAPGANVEFLFSGLVQPDGKIVLVGYFEAAGIDIPQGVVLRLNPDGSLDPTFNGSGRFNAPATLFLSLFTGVVRQPDGKIILAGLTLDLASQSFLGFLIRLNTNGQVDITFGTAGILRLSALSSRLNFIADFARAPDGKLLLAGAAFPSLDAIRVARLNANGSVDATFGTNGVVDYLPTGATEIFPSECRIQPDGRPIVLSTFQVDSTTEVGYALLRLTTNGQLDASFGNGGEVIEKDNSIGADLALQTDGKILVGGIYSTATEDGFFVYRYNNDIVGTREALLDVGALSISPHPVRNQAMVRFELEEARRLQIDVVDPMGRTAATLSPMRTWEAGLNTLPFSAEQLPAGQYWLRLRDENGRVRSTPLSVVAH